MSDANAAYTVSDYINEVTPPLDNCLIYLDNVGFHSWLDKSAQAHTTSYYDAGVEVENRQLPNKNYGMWVNAVGGGNCGLYSSFSETLGCDYQYTDIDGNPHTGWDGGKVNYTYSSGGQYYTIQVTMGGRGTPSDGVNPAVPLLTTPNIPYHNNILNATRYLFLNSGTPSGTGLYMPGVMCCENRDLSNDNDKPDCIKYAINYLQYQSPSTVWKEFCVDNLTGIGLNVKKFLDSYNYPNNVVGYLKWSFSVWVRRLSVFPYYNNSINKFFGIGIAGAFNYVVNLKNLPVDEWVFISGTFYTNLRTEYYWQMAPSVAGWYSTDFDPLLWTTSEPLVAFANPKVDLIGAYDPNDHTKLWDIPEEAYIGLTPRRVL